MCHMTNSNPKFQKWNNRTTKEKRKRKRKRKGEGNKEESENN